MSHTSNTHPLWCPPDDIPNPAMEPKHFRSTVSGFTVDRIAATLGDHQHVCTFAFWDRATAELRNAGPHGEGFTLHAVLHRDAYVELHASMTDFAAVAFGASSFDGFTLHISDSVPPGDTTGRTNIVGVVPLGLKAAHPDDAPAVRWAVEGFPGLIPMSVGVTFITRPAP